MENMEKKISEIFGQNLKEIRGTLCLTQEQFAERIDISTKHLSNMEVGRRFPSGETLDKICSALDIPPALLFKTPDIVIQDAHDANGIIKAIEAQMSLATDRLKDSVQSSAFIVGRGDVKSGENKGQ